MPTEDDQSLASLLDMEQRGSLNLLIAQATEEMRNDVIRTFEAKVSATADVAKNQQDSRDAATHASHEQQESAQQERERIALSTPTVSETKGAALSYFDTWRDSVILRVGEILNSRDHAHQPKEQSHAHKVASGHDPKAAPDSTQYQVSIDKTLATVYPPLPNSLASLSQNERVTILNAILLLLLSLERYSAHSRTLLLRLASSLHVSATALTKMETDIAHGLLVAAEKMDASASTEAAQKASATSRKWKVGLASVAGAALIGVTGGLAAPLVAAGVGGLMGGLGLGATAAAGYLGALAGSGALVGGLFGAYGGRMTGRMMDEYAREVEDFKFLEIPKGHIGWKEKVRGEAKTAEKEKRRLRVTIGISGWLTEEKQVVSPWQVLGEGGEPFALRWELKALLSLGNAITNFVKSKAWGYIKKEIIKRTLLAGLWSALMLPLAAVKTAAKVVDSPWNIAKLRSEKAGKVLAHALINKAQGERPVSLIGYSLGARVIYHCLLSLAEQKAFGLVDSVVLMGAATPSDADSWRAIRSVVSGRLVNAYSENDYILAFLYRTGSVQLGIAGLQAVEGVHGVENVDMSETVKGHLQYPYMVGNILAKVGWIDIDEEMLLLEEKTLDQMEREKHLTESTDEPNEKELHEEGERLQREHEAQTEQGPGSHFERHRQHQN